MKNTERVIILELNQFPPINAGIQMLGQKHRICFECAMSAIGQVKEQKFALLSILVTFSCVYTERTQKLHTHIIAAMHRQRMLYFSFVLHSASVLLVTVTTCTNLMPLMYQYSCPIPHLSPRMLFQIQCVIFLNDEIYCLGKEICGECTNNCEGRYAQRRS